jgi:hypothetical protein
MIVNLVKRSVIGAHVLLNPLIKLMKFRLGG